MNSTRPSDSESCPVARAAVSPAKLPEHAIDAPIGESLIWYRAILAATLDPIVTIDVHGCILAASDSIERVFGWKPAELFGRNINVLMPEPHHSQHDGYLAGYRQTGRTNILNHTRQFEAIRKDGARFPVEIAVTRVDIPGREEPFFTGILKDVTERHLAETELRAYREHLEDLIAERTRELEASHHQLRQADRLASIGTLAAGLGHDMNNVLLPVRCRLDALAKRDLPRDIAEHFEAVRSSTHYLQHLADALHLLALDPDDAEASTHATDLSAWWEQVGPLLARGLPRQARLATSWPSDLPALSVPAHRLTQAVLNLIVNAGEAIGPEGRVRIWAESDAARRRVRLGVTDDGAGMSEDVSRRALDPFFTTKKRGLGTGLGLSLVHGVVRAAGGTIEIDSAPGRGTTIVLTFPVAHPDRRDERAASARPALRIAVAVNDPRLGGLIATLLRAADVEPVLVEPDAPGTALIWVVQPDETARAALERAVREDRRPHRVIALGTDAGPLHRYAAVTTVDPNDFEAIRAALAAAIKEHHA